MTNQKAGVENAGLENAGLENEEPENAIVEIEGLTNANVLSKGLRNKIL